MAGVPMIGGDSAQSYAKNSSYQKGTLDAAKELINEAISEKLDLKILGFGTSNTVKIADLGCSVGPNTFFAMGNVIEAVRQKFLQAKNRNTSALEFQVFFSDLCGNDFNTLFKTLPHSRAYFAAGVPGSFHGRLFPKSSLHVAHISTALHWLSKLPKEVLDRNSPAWNKGSVQCNGLVEEVVRAYSTQFKNDIDSFLNARAEEIVPGGLMFILAGVVPDGGHICPTLSGAVNDVLGSCLNDLAKMGVLSEEQVDSFNLPLYHPTPKEFEAIFKTNGKFSIEKMEKLIQPARKTPITPKVYVLEVRAVTDGFIRNHFGEEFVERIFDHLTTKIEENLSKLGEKELINHNMFIALKRIGN